MLIARLAIPTDWPRQFMQSVYKLQPQRPARIQIRIEWFFPIP